MKFVQLILRKMKRGGEGAEGKGEEAFLVMWPRTLSALNPPLPITHQRFKLIL